MTIDIRPAGSILQFSRYVSERPQHGLARTIGRMFGLAPKPMRRPASVEQVSCPFPFALVPGADAEDALNELAGLRPDCTPVIFGKPETAAGMLGLRQEESYEDLLASMDALDLGRWLAGRSAELKQIGIEAPRGAWPAEHQPNNGLYCVRRVQPPGEFEPEVVIGLVATGEPALVPLLLNYGDWNDCPPSIVHAALAQR
jgi:hypothetical protein